MSKEAREFLTLLDIRILQEGLDEEEYDEAYKAQAYADHCVKKKTVELYGDAYSRILKEQVDSVVEQEIIVRKHGWKGELENRIDKHLKVDPFSHEVEGDDDYNKGLLKALQIIKEL